MSGLKSVSDGIGKKPGLAIISFTAMLILAVLIAVRLVFHVGPDLRSLLVFGAGAAVLIGANVSMLTIPNEMVPIGYKLSFDSVILIIIGLIAGTLGCPNWTVAVLLAGVFFLVGGFVGLLFGYPRGLDKQAAVATTTAPIAPPAGGPPVPPPAGGPPVPPPPTHRDTLLADTATTLGKIIAGFSLAKLSNVQGTYGQFALQMGVALGIDKATAGVFAGALIAYFFATGFLSGLILPQYFMTEFR